MRPTKIAHKPMLAPQGLDAAKAARGEGFMLYWIDAERNHSKFYEGIMLPNGDGSWRVMLRWGALTDSGFTGRIDGAKFDEKFRRLSLPEAKRVLALKYREKTGKGYTDAWGPNHKTPNGKPLPKGQYPIGLKRDVGFGWGVQQTAFCIPALRQIQNLLEKAQGDLRQQDVYGAAEQLASAAGIAQGALMSADSTMARKILDNIAHMQGRADTILGGDYSSRVSEKALRDWSVALSRLMSYLDKQMSVCHGKLAAAKTAKGRMSDLNWREIVYLLGGSALQKLPDGSIRFYKQGWGDGVVVVSDNGGEVNVSQVTRLTRDSVPYWDNTRANGMVGEHTMAYRLEQAVKGRPLDYKLDLDDNSKAAAFDPRSIGKLAAAAPDASKVLPLAKKLHQTPHTSTSAWDTADLALRKAITAPGPKTTDGAGVKGYDPAGQVVNIEKARDAWVRKGKTAGFDPRSIGTVKKPSGDPDELRIVKDTDQRWFGEVSDLVPAGGKVWDGSGTVPESYERTMTRQALNRLAARYMASIED